METIKDRAIVKGARGIADFVFKHIREIEDGCTVDFALNNPATNIEPIEVFKKKMLCMVWNCKSGSAEGLGCRHKGLVRLLLWWVMFVSSLHAFGHHRWWKSIHCSEGQ